MLDIAVAYNRYKFLGDQFLTWLWFLIETDQETIRLCDPDIVGLEVGNRMVLENRTTGGLETISIKGDAAGLEEAIVSLSKGAAVSEIQLIYKTAALEWVFAIKGESLSFSGIKLPENTAVQIDEDLDGMILDKLYLYENPLQLIDTLYQSFIQLRLSEKWSSQITVSIKTWLNAERSIK
jgi:hypothetical protein